MTQADITIIENIASGELTHQERTKHLQRFQSQSPECWPALAQAFIEKQILRETFAAIDELEQPNEPKITTIKNKPWILPAAAAAMLIIGISLGSMLNNQPQPETPTPAKITTQPTAETPQPAPQPATAYVATYLENGDQLVVPINYYPANQ